MDHMDIESCGETRQSVRAVPLPDCAYLQPGEHCEVGNFFDLHTMMNTSVRSGESSDRDTVR